MYGVLDGLRRKFARAERPCYDNCAFVEFFRSNGDGQVPRLQALCRCPDGPFRDRPVPYARHCERYQRASAPVEKPVVGDPTLTA